MERESQITGPTCLIVIGMAGSGKTTFVKVSISFLLIRLVKA